MTLSPFTFLSFRFLLLSGSSLSTSPRTILREDLLLPWRGESSAADREHHRSAPVDLCPGPVLSLDSIASLLHVDTLHSRSAPSLLRHLDHRRSLGGLRGPGVARGEQLADLRLVQEVLVSSLPRSRSLRLVAGLRRSSLQFATTVADGQGRVPSGDARTDVQSLLRAGDSLEDDQVPRRASLAVTGVHQRDGADAHRSSDARLLRLADPRLALADRQLSDRQRRRTPVDSDHHSHDGQE